MNTPHPLQVPSLNGRAWTELSLNDAEPLIRDGKVSSRWFLAWFKEWIIGKSEFRMMNGRMEQFIYRKYDEGYWALYAPAGFSMLDLYNKPL